jgi:hypothetical protein
MTTATATDPAALTTGQLATAVSRLGVLGMPALADWIHADGERAERPEVEAVVRDVLALTASDLGYHAVPGHPDAGEVRRRGTRTRLLLRWADDPRYDDGT